ncbi:IclR family transcriptional regulator [Streptomyces xanthochromogenes]
MRDAARPGARSVLEGAFALLGAIERLGQAGVTRLAVESGLPKATAHRLLQQLTELGAVERTRGQYRMGPELFRLGQAWQPHPRLGAAARAPLRRLATATGATVTLAVLREGRTLIAQASPGELDARLPVRAGSVFPWATAAGKLLVAEARPNPLFGPLPPGWRWEAASIQERGIAFDRQELVEGVSCVAAPVLGPRGRPVAAVCALVGPEGPLERFSEAVRQAGCAISGVLRTGRSAQWNRA